jgi:hypothetical protein
MSSRAIGQLKTFEPIAFHMNHKKQAARSSASNEAQHLEIFVLE